MTLAQPANPCDDRHANFGVPASRLRIHTHLVMLAALAVVFSLQPRVCRAVDMDVLVGFGQSTTAGARYRPDSWIPVTVYLTGVGARGSAQLQLAVRQNGGETVYTRRVVLAEGTVNQAENFTVRLHDADWYGIRAGGPAVEIEARLILDGRSLAGPKKIVLPGPIGLETFNVLALTRDGSGFDFLSRKKLGLIHRGYNPANVTMMNGGMVNFNAAEESQRTVINPNATFQLLYTDPRALPSVPQGYDMIDAVALGDLPLDGLTRDQILALKDYVRLGGLLIISGGGDIARLRSAFYRDMSPIENPRPIVVQSIPQLESRYRSPLPLNGGTELAFGALKVGARTLLPDASGRPLIAALPYGAGCVVFTAFDFQDRSIKAWSGDTALWHDLLRSGDNDVSARELLASASDLGHFNALYVADALAGVRASRAPAFEMLLAFCAAYLVLLVPVNYIVLRKLDRRELTWVTAPVLILGFTFASYLFARSIKGGALSANCAAVFEASAYSSVVAGYGQITIYSPRRAAYDISIGSTDTQDNPNRRTVPSEVFVTPGQSLGQELTVDNDESFTTLRGAVIRLWDKRSFDAPILASLGGGAPKMDGSIDAVTQALPDGKHVKVTVTNRTRFMLDHCSLLGQDENVQIGNLAPGASVTRNITWNARQVTGSIPITYNGLAAQAPDATHASDSPEDTRQRIAVAMASTMSGGTGDNRNNGMPGQDVRGYGRALNAFVGWFHDPVVDVRVDGQSPDGQEVNLLVVHLPTPANAPVKMLRDSEPFAVAPITEFADQNRLGMPGLSR